MHNQPELIIPKNPDFSLILGNQFWAITKITVNSPRRTGISNSVWLLYLPHPRDQQHTLVVQSRKAVAAKDHFLANPDEVSADCRAEH